jgi:hypothetical protein
MEVYGGATSNNPPQQQFLPNKYQFATYYGQKNMMGMQQPQIHNSGQYEYSIDGSSSNGLNIVGINQNLNGRMISSELTSYQSEKKIAGASEHYYNSGGRGTMGQRGQQVIIEEEGGNSQRSSSGEERQNTNNSMARLTQTSGGIVPTNQKRGSGREEGGSYNPGGAAAAPVVLQGRNSVASINSGYNEPTRSQPRGGGNPGQILSGTGDTGSGMHPKDYHNQ